MPEPGADLVSLESLHSEAVVGTSSPRRVAQLKHLRPDVVVKDVRGNVDTRLRKLDAGGFDALILACAGLRRLGLENRITGTLFEMLPAIGQGALGLETRVNDENTIAAVSKLNHAPTQFACTAERSLLRALGGGCQLPIAGYARLQDEQLMLEGLVADPSGKQLVRVLLSGSASNAEELGREVAQELKKQGADKLLALY
jgi:hydroxymethylbilane synthase